VRRIRSQLNQLPAAMAPAVPEHAPGLID